MSKANKYLSNVTISLDLARTVGDLRPIYKSEKGGAGLKMLCPECDIPNTVEKRYTCSNSHGPFTSAEVTGRGKLVNKQIVLVNVEEMPKAENMPYLEVNVHPREQVEYNTWPTGSSYQFLPEVPEKDSFYGVLCDLVCEPDMAFVGEMTIRNTTKLFRLVRAPQGLVLTELCYPGRLYEYEEVNPNYDGRHLRMALDLAEAKLTDFTPEAYKDAKKEYLDKVLSTSTPVPMAQDPNRVLIDVEAMLTASLERLAAR